MKIAPGALRFFVWDNKSVFVKLSDTHSALEYNKTTAVQHYKTSYLFLLVKHLASLFRDRAVQ